MSDGHNEPINLSHEEIKALFFYNPETGILYKRGTEEPVGFKGSRGYVLVNINGKMIGAHRIAHMWMLGKWPPRIVDHVNGDPSDNRWANLRLASPAHNAQNRRPVDRILEKNGYKGVTRTKGGRWIVKVQAHWKLTSALGSFDSAYLAHQAYKKIVREQHGQFAKTEKAASSYQQSVWSAEAQLKHLTERRADVVEQLANLDASIEVLKKHMAKLEKTAVKIAEGQERGRELSRIREEFFKEVKAKADDGPRP